MKSTTTSWVKGEDFFNRRNELKNLKSLVLEGNHVMLTGQRGVGKTSILQELGIQLKAEDWMFVYASLKDAKDEADSIKLVCKAFDIRSSLPMRYTQTKRYLVTKPIRIICSIMFDLTARIGLNARNWPLWGTKMIREGLMPYAPALLVIDDLQIFLCRIFDQDNGEERVAAYLNWLCGALDSMNEQCQVLIVSNGLGINLLQSSPDNSDRINRLTPFHLEPWNKEISVACFKRLARSHQLPLAEGTPEAVYEALGLGIPHYIQIFFAQLKKYTESNQRKQITPTDVVQVYRAVLLDPKKCTDFDHYETQLKDDFDGINHSLAVDILTETAIQGTFSSKAKQQLETLYSPSVEDVSELMDEALFVLVNDGYLESTEDGYRFPSRLLADWWSVRYRDRHTPLNRRSSVSESGGLVE